MSHKLPTINAEELLSCPMPPTRFIIDQLLPQGLHILAGATKIGKSWLALALCLCVVKGEALWSFAAQKCGVLYLCLEDSYQRIRCRLLDLTEDAPDTLCAAGIHQNKSRAPSQGKKRNVYGQPCAVRLSERPR